MHLLHGPHDVLAEWVMLRAGGVFTPGSATALVVGTRDGQPLAGAAFTDYNGRNVSVHLAIEDPVAAVFLFPLIGAYTFEQLHCSRLTLIAEASNLKAVKLHEKLGAVHEGTLVGAGRSGDDILVSRLTPDSRIWRKLNARRSRRQALVTEPA